MFGATEGSDTQNEILRGLKYPAGYTTATVADNFKAINSNIAKTNGLKIGNLYISFIAFCCILFRTNYMKISNGLCFTYVLLQLTRYLS